MYLIILINYENKDANKENEPAAGDCSRTRTCNAKELCLLKYNFN